MEIYSRTWVVIIDAGSVHLFSDSSKKNWIFSVRVCNNKYHCPVRGTVNSYRLVQATEHDSPENTFCAYYLSYMRNNVTSLSLEYDDGFDYFSRILWMVVLWVLKQQNLQLMSTMPTLITVGNICIIKKNLTWVLPSEGRLKNKIKW